MKDGIALEKEAEEDCAPIICGGDLYVFGDTTVQYVNWTASRSSTDFLDGVFSSTQPAHS